MMDNAEASWWLDGQMSYGWMAHVGGWLAGLCRCDGIGDYQFIGIGSGRKSILRLEVMH